MSTVRADAVQWLGVWAGRGGASMTWMLLCTSYWKITVWSLWRAEPGLVEWGGIGGVDPVRALQESAPRTPSHLGWSQDGKARGRWGLGGDGAGRC